MLELLSFVLFLFFEIHDDRKSKLQAPDFTERDALPEIKQHRKYLK